MIPPHFACAIDDARLAALLRGDDDPRPDEVPSLLREILELRAKLAASQEAAALDEAQANERYWKDRCEVLVCGINDLKLKLRRATALRKGKLRR